MSDIRAPLVVMTRLEERGSPFVTVIRAARARFWSLPTTTTDVATINEDDLDRHLASIAAFDCLIFTSARAVDRVCSRASFINGWHDAVKRPAVAVVGPATALRARQYGLPVDVEPASPGGAALAHALVRRLRGTARPRVLWPRAAGSGPVLRQVLTTQCVEVCDPIVYTTRAAAPARIGAFANALRHGRVDCVCFCSPSSADGLAKALGRSDLAPLRGARVASLGATTSDALARLGAPPDVESTRADGASFARAVVRSLQQHCSRGPA